MREPAVSTANTPTQMSHPSARPDVVETPREELRFVLVTLSAIVIDTLFLLLWIGLLTGVSYLESHVLPPVVAYDATFRLLLDVFRVAFAVVTLVAVLAYIVSDLTTLWMRSLRRISVRLEEEAPTRQQVAFSDKTTSRPIPSLGFAILGGLVGLSLGLTYGEITAPIGAGVGVAIGAGISVLNQRLERMRWQTTHR